MRTAFIQQLISEARHNENIFLLVGDLGYNVIEPFAKEFPDRFRNVGIAEQNMAGLAAGLAMTGYNVYIYSIGNFPTLRCIEQIRNDIAYHQANVKVVAVGGGYAYADLGATHHATEALGIMRTIPNMVVCSPSDPIEARAITSISAEYHGPMYIQLGKAGEKIVRSTPFSPQIGDIPIYQEGESNKEAILVSGSIFAEIISDAPSEKYDVYTVPFIKPINKVQVCAIANRYDRIIVVEEHQLSCGVGSAIIEQINDLYYTGLVTRYPRIKRIAIKDVFSTISGSQSFLRKANGLYLS